MPPNAGGEKFKNACSHPMEMTAGIIAGNIKKQNTKDGSAAKNFLCTAFGSATNKKPAITPFEDNSRRRCLTDITNRILPCVL